MLAYQQSVGHDANFVDGWLALGAAHERQSDLHAAIECYEKANAARPDDPDTLFKLALLLTRRGAYDEALPLWKRYLEVATTAESRPRALRLLSLCRVSARRHREQHITELLSRRA
jgi:tetratricopeptide (TPR) repeat protein